MVTNKRYYWLKLKEDFFTDMRMKRLRKISAGGTYTIIYLKLLLLSLKDEGKLHFENVDETFIKELSLVIDETEDDIMLTLQFLERVGLLQVVSDEEFFLTELPSLIGSETDSARRVRKSREQKSLQCNTSVTLMQQKCNTEKEKDIDKDKDIEKEVEVEKEKKQPTATATEKVKKCVMYYQEMTGIVPVPLIQTEMQNYLDKKIQPDLICIAVQDAVAQGVTKWSYIKAILERCLHDNIYTAEDFARKKYKEEPVSKGYMIRKSAPIYRVSTQ